MIGQPAHIKGISYYLPKRIVDNRELVKEFPEWSADKVAAKVGVLSRHVSAEGETAVDMAEKAALRLFAENEVKASDIDFILFCTQSPDYILPSSACILQHRLGVPTSAGALDFNLGCSGFVYGLSLAKGLLATGVAKNILLLTSETYTKYLHPDDKSNRSIFGDAAAACLVAGDGFARIGEFALGTDGSGAENLILECGGARVPEPQGTEVEDEDGHIRRSDFLYMNGSAIFSFTLAAVPEAMRRVLQINGIEKQDVDLYVFHQANKFMLQTIRKICTLPKEKFYINLEETGNTVSSTIPIALCQCKRDGLLTSGSNVMVCGFGVGLSWGATMLQIL